MDGLVQRPSQSSVQTAASEWRTIHDRREKICAQLHTGGETVQSARTKRFHARVKVCRRAHQPISPDRQGDRNDVVVGLSLEGTTEKKRLGVRPGSLLPEASVLGTLPRNGHAQSRGSCATELFHANTARLRVTVARQGTK